MPAIIPIRLRVHVSMYVSCVRVRVRTRAYVCGCMWVSYAPLGRAWVFGVSVWGDVVQVYMPVCLVY